MADVERTVREEDQQPREEDQQPHEEAKRKQELDDLDITDETGGSVKGGIPRVFD